jgi:hypothetical protein
MTAHIATGPLSAADQVKSVPDKIASYLAAARAAAADGITWAEFGELLLGLLRMSVDVLDAVRVMSGEQKKAWVVEAAGVLFDEVAGKAVPLALWPVWLVVRPAVRSLVLALAAGAVEQVLPMVRSGR